MPIFPSPSLAFHHSGGGGNTIKSNDTIPSVISSKFELMTFRTSDTAPSKTTRFKSRLSGVINSLIVVMLAISSLRSILHSTENVIGILLVSSVGLIKQFQNLTRLCKNLNRRSARFIYHPLMTLGLLVRCHSPSASMTMGMLSDLQRSITMEIRASIDWLRPSPGPEGHLFIVENT